MERRTILISSLIFLSATLPAVLGQDVKSQTNPVLPPEILGPQLIAWSQIQKPQPIPQPLPSPSRSSQGSEQQSVQLTMRSQPQPPAAQSFTGTIVKDGDRYILRAVRTKVYQLDDQERAKEYEGKQVKIVGTLDPPGNTLHVTSIEFLS